MFPAFIKSAGRAKPRPKAKHEKIKADENADPAQNGDNPSQHDENISNNDAPRHQ